MNVMDYARSALRHWSTILLAGVLAATAGFLFGKMQPREFQTHARFVISPSSNITDDNDIAQSLDALANKRAIVSTFAQVVLSQRSFDQATRAAGATPQEVEQLKITTAVSPEANVVEVFVVGTRAQLSEKMLELIGAESTRSFEALYTIYAVEALDVAGPKTEQVAPKPVRSALIGAVLGAALAFLAGLVDDRIKADRAGSDRITAAEDRAPGATPPGPDHPGAGSTAALHAPPGPDRIAIDKSEPGRGLVLHPMAVRAEEVPSVVPVTAGAATTEVDTLEVAYDWLRELDDLSRQVRRWPDGISTADPDDAQERWRRELDDLGGMLQAWAEGSEGGPDGRGYPGGPAAT